MFNRIRKMQRYEIVEAFAQFFVALITVIVVAGLVAIWMAK